MLRALVVLVAAGSTWLLACGDPVGSASCIGVTFQHDTASCLTTFSRCDDGRGYDLACNAGKCTCSVDNKVVSPAKASDCANDPVGVDAACGWDLH